CRHEFEPLGGRLTLQTDAGPFCVTGVNEAGRPLTGSLARGENLPARGWRSRYYGLKEPTPSLVFGVRAHLPCTLVTVLSAGEALIEVAGNQWRVAAGESSVTFALEDGNLERISRTGLRPRRLASL